MMNDEEKIQLLSLMVLNKTKRYTPEYLMFTKDVWEYIDNNCCGLFNGIVRVVLPDNFKEKIDND